MPRSKASAPRIANPVAGNTSVRPTKGKGKHTVTPSPSDDSRHPSPVESVHGSSSSGQSRLKKRHRTPQESSDEEPIPSKPKKRAVAPSPPHSSSPELPSDDEVPEVRITKKRKRLVPPHASPDDDADDEVEENEHEHDLEGDEVFEEEPEAGNTIGFQNPDLVAERLTGALEGVKAYQK